MQCLDSSALIELLVGSEKGRKIKEMLSDIIFMTSFSVHELFVGTADKELTMMQDFLKGFEVLPYNVECAIKSPAIEKALSKQGKKINIIDVFIASICINSNKMLITTDKDFKHIKGLDVKIIA